MILEISQILPKVSKIRQISPCILRIFHFSQFGFVQCCDAPESREELEGRRVGRTGSDRAAVGTPQSGNMSGMHSVLSVLLFMAITVPFRPSVNLFFFISQTVLLKDMWWAGRGFQWAPSHWHECSWSRIGECNLAHTRPENGRDPNHILELTTQSPSYKSSIKTH